MEGLVDIPEYLDSTEAQVAKAKLNALGVSAEVFVDDLGRQGPSRGRLVVPAGQVAEACEVLGFEVPTEKPPGFIERNAALLLLGLVALAAAGVLAWLAG